MIVVGSLILNARISQQDPYTTFKQIRFVRAEEHPSQWAADLHDPGCGPQSSIFGLGV